MTIRKFNQQLLPWLAYPVVMALGLSIHIILISTGLGVQLSSYFSIILAVLTIAYLEYLIPYRERWKPSLSEVKTDALFTLFSQILLPKFLSFLAAVTLLNYVLTHNLAITSIWPHQAPVIIQVLLMMGSAEFFRYWLHRLAHDWSPLWRLHAVHHSPDKLYWLNTSRFHPVEKAIQFLFDALPFILLGVTQDVLAIYFVFYAINGFFQHSNVNLQMGALNHVISSAQLHRWHHAKEINVSGRNFGNNLIIWDSLFGTRYLPKDQHVVDLGLFNRAYPMSFLDQMKTPGTAGIDKFQTPILGFKKWYLNCRCQLEIFIAKIIYKWPFDASLSNPMKSQHKLLSKIINQNKNSDFGKQHQFENITNWSDFSKQVAIQDYEDLRPYIEQQEQSKQPCLTEQQPIYYAVTSGTTGQPKHIPVLEQTIAGYKQALAIFACVQNKVKRHSFAGDLLAIPGAYHEGNLAGGSPFGSISGLMYHLMPHYLQQKYVTAEALFAIEDHELKYYLIMRLALQHRNISYMVSANPSTFLKLLETLNQHYDSLIDDIEASEITTGKHLDQNIKQTLGPYLHHEPERIQQLKSLIPLKGKLGFNDVWPNLKLVVTWTSGSCGIAIERLRKQLPKNCHIIDLGYLASELRGSITLEHTGNSGVPTIHDVFYEFIEVTDYDNGQRQTLTLGQLQAEHNYYIIITTPAGLYRYFMNDIIEVTGFHKQTPLIRFVQKGKGITNITGEKLAEQQLIAAVNAVNQQLNIDPSFYIALASVSTSSYQLYIEYNLDAEHYAQQIDQKLQSLNTEYRSKRHSHRLKPLTVHCLKARTSLAYKEHALAKGLRESQYKYMPLQYEDDCDFPMNDYLL